MRHRVAAALVLLLPMLVACGGRTQNSAALSSSDPLPTGAHSDGLYDLESDPSGAAFRWTNGRALIDGPKLEHQPVALHVALFALAPTRVSLSVDGMVVVRRNLSAGATDVAATLTRVSTTPRIVIESPTFRPAVDGGATRTLGVQLRGLNYVTSLDTIDLALDLSSPANTHGVYPIEKDPEGRMFRWTDGSATIELPPGVPGPLILGLRSLQPTRVRVTVDSVDAASLEVAGEVRRELKLHGKKAHVIHIISSTFTPTPVNGYTRKLGVEVTRLSST